MDARSFVGDDDALEHLAQEHAHLFRELRPAHQFDQQRAEIVNVAFSDVQMWVRRILNLVALLAQHVEACFLLRTRRQQPSLIDLLKLVILDQFQ